MKQSNPFRPIGKLHQGSLKRNPVPAPAPGFPQTTPGYAGPPLIVHRPTPTKKGK